jgi:hypothetical protein
VTHFDENKTDTDIVKTQEISAAPSRMGVLCLYLLQSRTAFFFHISFKPHMYILAWWKNGK